MKLLLLILILPFNVKAQNEIREYIIDSAVHDLRMTKVATDCSPLYKNKTVTFDYKSFKVPSAYDKSIIEYRVTKQESEYTSAKDYSTTTIYKCLNSNNQECLLQLISPSIKDKNFIQLIVSDEYKFYLFYLRAKNEDYKNIKSKEDWIFIGETQLGDMEYVKSKCVEKTDNYIKIWNKTILKKIEIEGKLYYKVKELSLQKYNCVLNKLLVSTIIRYDSDGNILQNLDFSQKAEWWQDIVPETMMELRINFVCSKFGK